MAIVLKKSQKYFFQRQENIGKLNGHIEEIYSGLNVVKVYNGVEDSNKQFDLFNKELFNLLSLVYLFFNQGIISLNSAPTSSISSSDSILFNALNTG